MSDERDVKAHNDAIQNEVVGTYCRVCLQVVCMCNKFMDAKIKLNKNKSEYRLISVEELNEFIFNTMTVEDGTIFIDHSDYIQFINSKKL